MFTVFQLQKRLLGPRAAPHGLGPPAAFQRLTGVTPEEFDSIVEAFEPLWNEAEIKRLNIRKRKRAIGAGPTFKLDPVAQVLMTLIYLRQYCFLTPTAAPDGLGSHARISRLAHLRVEQKQRVQKHSTDPACA